MINSNSLNFFEKFDQDSLFKPNYKTYSFANIPSTIFHLLTGKNKGNLLPVDCFGQNYPKPKKIVLFLIDAFGFKLWKKYYKDFEITQKIVDRGILTPISTIFPSATSSSVSTINCNCLALEHGIIEWFLYVREYGQIITSLPFKEVGEFGRSCLNLGCDPKHLLTTKNNFYSEFSQEGIVSYRVMGERIINSIYNKITEGASKDFGFFSLQDAFQGIKNIISNNQEKSFTYFYWDGIDTSGHEFGPDSIETQNAVSEFWLEFNEAFANFKKDQDVLFLFTADHGQIGVDPNETYYLNKEIPQIKAYLKVGGNGQIITPVGAYRDVILHINEEKVFDAKKLLEEKLKGRALVLFTSEAIEMGLFGPPPFSKEAVERAGQILILPYDNNCVWWYEEGKFEVNVRGMHGGLSEEEMLSVFGVW